VLVDGVFAVEPVVVVRCQRSIESSDQAMPVISWWYPHRFNSSMVLAFDRVALNRVFRLGCRSLVGGDRIDLVRRFGEQL
jgi:hypothetical protein